MLVGLGVRAIGQAARQGSDGPIGGASSWMAGPQPPRRARARAYRGVDACAPPAAHRRCARPGRQRRADRSGARHAADNGLTARLHGVVRSGFDARDGGAVGSARLAAGTPRLTSPRRAPRRSWLSALYRRSSACPGAIPPPPACCSVPSPRTKTRRSPQSPQSTQTSRVDHSQRTRPTITAESVEHADLWCVGTFCTKALPRRPLREHGMSRCLRATARNAGCDNTSRPQAQTHWPSRFVFAGDSC